MNCSVTKIACTSSKTVDLFHWNMWMVSEKDKNCTLYLNVLSFFKSTMKQNKLKVYHILSPCKPKKFSKLFSKPSYYIIFHQLIFPSNKLLEKYNTSCMHEEAERYDGTLSFHCTQHTKNVFEILHHSCSSLWPLGILLDHQDKNNNNTVT